MGGMESGGPVCVWDRDEVRTMLWALADILAEVRALRSDLLEDDGEEMEEDEP
jgi:hypothetical protein